MHVEAASLKERLDAINGELEFEVRPLRRAKTAQRTTSSAQCRRHGQSVL